ncbi:hypothetical protein [Parasphingopyxis marina]|uniref:Uncharacterized protein n=1 Tax=Parasphingopyxis marina TaxID=2761622 RepID=A0A842HZE5_9SPHN|nr:hypothetical protein [Parasphingopyxis marina]MBC2777803.1 hypothetical protein [Parasphingopyxis marina]
MILFLTVFFVIIIVGGTVAFSALAYWSAPKFGVSPRYRGLLTFGAAIAASGILWWSTFGPSEGPVDPVRYEQALPELMEKGGSVLRAHIIDEATHYTLFLEFALTSEQFTQLRAEGHFKRDSFHGDLLVLGMPDWFGRGWNCVGGERYNPSHASPRLIDSLDITHCPHQNRAYAVQFWP